MNTFYLKIQQSKMTNYRILQDTEIFVKYFFSRQVISNVIQQCLLALQSLNCEAMLWNTFPFRKKNTETVQDQCKLETSNRNFEPATKPIIFVNKPQMGTIFHFRRRYLAIHLQLLIKSRSIKSTNHFLQNNY